MPKILDDHVQNVELYLSEIPAVHVVKILVHQYFLSQSNQNFSGQTNNMQIDKLKFYIYLFDLKFFSVVITKKLVFLVSDQKSRDSCSVSQQNQSN